MRWAILSVIIFFGATAWWLETVYKTQPVAGIDEIKMLDLYKNTPLAGDLTGSYYGRGEEFVVEYYFGAGNTVAKKKSRMSGRVLEGIAKYDRVGSVLVFSDVQGDGVLFSKNGEVIQEYSPGGFITPEGVQVGRQTVILDKKTIADTYTNTVDDSDILSLFEKVFLLLMGISGLLFIVTATRNAYLGR